MLLAYNAYKSQKVPEKNPTRIHFIILVPTNLFEIFTKSDGAHAWSTANVHGQVKVRVGLLTVVHDCLKQLVSVPGPKLRVSFRLVQTDIHLGLVHCGGHHGLSLGDFCLAHFQLSWNLLFEGNLVLNLVKEKVQL